MFPEKLEFIISESKKNLQTWSFGRDSLSD